MPQITDIKSQKRQKRVNIFLDGKFSFGLDLETLAKKGLKVGQEISEKEIGEAVKEGEFGQVYNRILKFLSFRPRSEKEVIDWLKKKNIGPRTTQFILKKLKSQALIDDEKFAKWWIEQRINFRPQGLRVTGIELRKKGVPFEVITNLLDKMKVEFSEKDLACRSALKKKKSLEKLPYKQAREKLISFLARRGFSWQTIEEAVDELLGS